MNKRVKALCSFGKIHQTEIWVHKINSALTQICVDRLESKSDCASPSSSYCFCRMCMCVHLCVCAFLCVYLCLDVLLWCSDKAGTAEPQHDHNGQEETGR